jgi:acetyltransferase-like isoleucine patch superfamily enzyme
MSRSSQLSYYVQAQSTSLPRYALEQTCFALLGGLPGLIGIGLRGLVYKLILKSEGIAAIEHGVRLAQPANIRNVFLDYGVYLHACPDGIRIGDGSFIMHGSVLHVFNFRNLPHAGIILGRQCFIGEHNVIRGQGGVVLGDYVYTGSLVQILAVNHVFDDPDTPIKEQGITAQGIVVEDDVWLASGVIVLDGVHIGQGCVVGAGAVVTEDLPPFGVAVGSPARVVRDRRQAQEIKRKTAAQVHFGELERMRQRSDEQ